MKTSLNLLPNSLDGRRIARKLLRLWSYVAAAAMLLAVAVTVYQDHVAARVQHRHDSLQKNCDAARQTLRRVKLLRSDLAEAERRQTILPDADNQQQLLTLLGLFSEAARTNAEGVAIEQLSYTLNVAPPGGPSPEDATRLRVDVRGVASSSLALADFVATIREWNVFTKVEITSSSEVKIGDSPAHRYVLECLH